MSLGKTPWKNPAGSLQQNSFQGTFLCVIIDSPPGVFQIANVLSLGYKNLGKDPTGSLHLN